jgi:RNA polymerase sigma-70 factor (ECF subfamily)
MAEGDATRWSMIRGAASGNASDREAFARTYEPVIRSYLGGRWRYSALIQEIDDAVQEVFVDCYKGAGVLDRADQEHAGGFRAYFFGVIRKTALVFERRAARRKDAPGADSWGLDRMPTDDEGLSTVFDRAWAAAVLQEAAHHQATLAEEMDDGAVRRVDLLRLRFGEGMPIREIAELWRVDAAWLHHEYARARDEFRVSLLAVVESHHPGASREKIRRECARLLESFD